MTGQGRPLTRMTSPHSPEWSRSSNSSDPFAANMTSVMVRGTSKSPWGSRANSLSSCRWYWAARPVYTLCEVRWTAWSWYHMVRAAWSLGHLYVLTNPGSVVSSA